MTENTETHEANVEIQIVHEYGPGHSARGEHTCEICGKICVVRKDPYEDGIYQAPRTGCEHVRYVGRREFCVQGRYIKQEAVSQVRPGKRPRYYY